MLVLCFIRHKFNESKSRLIMTSCIQVFNVTNPRLALDAEFTEDGSNQTLEKNSVGMQLNGYLN